MARQAMLERGLLPDFPVSALNELGRIPGPAKSTESSTRDLRHLLWCSIDNDDSRDLDQLTVAESLTNGSCRILIAIADVDALVKRESALDDHARHNTTSVYTAGEIFPMLPEKLSTDLTSLNFESERMALVVEFTVSGEGTLQASSLYQALVQNHAKLAYRSVAEWMETTQPLPDGIAKAIGLQENLLLQDRVAQKMKVLRHQNGALDLESREARPIFEGDELKDIRGEHSNRAKELIEEFMIAANGVTARFLTTHKFPSVRRIVRTPKRWDRIVALASERGYQLPDAPDAQSLEKFATWARTTDPLHFPDLSLSIIKLLGSGEYIVEYPGDTGSGHFGLAVRDYAHSTAPNRRFPDLLAQRLLKAVLTGNSPPYDKAELEALAEHCTFQEDAAKKVERLVAKSAAALLLESRIGQRFEALVTGAADKGTWVRLLQFPVEGRLVSGFQGVDVGQQLRVELIHTDVEHGYIDFKKVD
ncbi:MAG: RNB domain-containing ribonuclease [Terriglobia bacterium]